MAGLSGVDVKAVAKWEVDGWQHGVTVEEVAALRAVINAAADEAPIQKYLAEHPVLLALLLGGAHGRWVWPQCKFGDHISDFVIGDADSAGFNWRLVELESPTAAVFLKSGEYADRARHALHQIKEWRHYVDKYPDRVRKRPVEGGLGLRWMSKTTAGLVLIGRTEHVEGRDPYELRRQTNDDERIMVRTYDWLLDQLDAVAVMGPTHRGVVPSPPDPRTPQLYERGR